MPPAGRYPGVAAVRSARLLGNDRALLAGLAGLAGAASLFAWLLSHPGQDPVVRVPVEHFYIVSAASLVAFGLATLLAIAAVQIAQYRVLFLALGFMAMGGIFAVHGLATPGLLLGGESAPYAGAVVGVSAYLALFIPSLLFAASYTPITAAFERRLPFSPAGWLIVALATVLAIYALIALVSTELLASLPFGVKPYSTGMALATLALLGFAAFRQGSAYLTARVPMQGILFLCFLLLAEAQVQMVLGQVWTMAWWQYHVSMLVAVTVAFSALNVQRARGQSLRNIVEATLELEVRVGAELQHVDTIAALAAAVEARDENTEGHNIRVAEIAVAIGREMELPNQVLRVLARAGLLHDVGKIGIPDSILSKPGPLDAAEWTIIKRHPEMGHKILARVADFRRESEIVNAHHERMDGTGYPKGLRGEAIPLESRIIAVADTYDVLVSDRPYRQAFDRIRALRILHEECGTHLWEPAVRALLHSLGERWDDTMARQPRAA